MTRIPGKSFSPQYPKLLAGPLNLKKVQITRVVIWFASFQNYEIMVNETLKSTMLDQQALYLNPKSTTN